MSYQTICENQHLSAYLRLIQAGTKNASKCSRLEWPHSPNKMQKNMNQEWKQTYRSIISRHGFCWLKQLEKWNPSTDTSPKDISRLPRSSLLFRPVDWLEYLCSNKARPKGVRWWESKAFVQQQKTWNPLLVGGWTNPSEKYARQIGFIFPKVGVENRKYLSCHHPDWDQVFGCRCVSMVFCCLGWK